jgi:hypothetical protein
MKPFHRWRRRLAYERNLPQGRRDAHPTESRRNGRFANRIYKRIFIGIALAYAFFVLSPVQAAPAKNEKEPPVEPSIGYDASAEVYRGQSQELKLHAISTQGYEVEFKILSSPKFGTLSETTRLSKDTVRVFYTHSGKLNQAEDSFKFQIKTGPQKAWAKKTGRIKILEPAPRFKATPDALDFGSVFVGQNATQSFRVTNVGGGILRGIVDVGPPFSLKGPPDIEIPTGNSKSFSVSFTPSASDTHLGKIVFQTDSKPYPEIPLQGTGEFRFEASDVVEFDPNPESTSATLSLTNKTANPLPIRFNTPSPLDAIPPIDIPPKSTEVVTIKLKPGFFSEKFVTLTVSDSFSSSDIKIQLPHPPPILEWDKKNTTQMGVVKLGQNKTLDLRLQNRGATPAKVGITAIGEGLTLSQKDFFIPPGEVVNIPAIWTFENAGEFEAHVSAECCGLKYDLTLLADVKNPATPVSAERPPKTSSIPTPTPTPIHVLTPEEVKERKKLFPSEIMYRLEQTGFAANVVISWKYLDNRPVTFIVETKSPLSQEDGVDPFQKRLEIPLEVTTKKAVDNWIAVPQSTANFQKLSDGRWQAVVTGLKPGYQDIRIGARPESLKQINYSAIVVKVPPLSFTWLNRWLLAPLFFICVIYLLRKKLLKIFVNTTE